MAAKGFGAKSIELLGSGNATINSGSNDIVLNPNSKVSVTGNFHTLGQILGYNGTAGSTDQILVSNGSGQANWSSITDTNNPVPSSFLQLTDTPTRTNDLYTSSDAGKIVVVNNSNTALEFRAHNFLNLDDTPGAYATDPSDANKYVKVNSNADGLIFDTLNKDDINDFDDAVNDLIEGNQYIPYGNITGTPNLHSVATSGSYDDLTGTPTHTFLGLTDTPSAYNNGKLLVSTLTGIDFTDTMTITKLVVSGPLVEKFTRIPETTSASLDLRDGNVFQLVLGSSTTSVAFTNCPASSGEAYAFTLIVSNTAADVSINWPNTIKWAGDTGDSNYVPTRTKATGKSDVWVFTTYDGGTTWLGVIASFGYDSLPTS